MRHTYQSHLSAQHLPVCEDDRSKNTENTGSNVSVTPSQHEERSVITTELAPEPFLLPSRESTQESPNLESEETSSQTLKDTISAHWKEMTNLSYKTVTAGHHYQFAQRCGENKVVPAGLDYTKNLLTL